MPCDGVRRTPEGWRIWAGSNDLSLFDDFAGFGIFVVTEEEQERQLREVAEKVVSWPLEGGGEGRAFLTGYPGGMEPPKALVIESPRADGTKARIEIPVAAFGSLAGLLHLWPQLLERK